ncbi:MAG: efflux RND transporter periplasmic adaptor subunit [Proteobacteria bacterium]|nr:efflux RND transporter periplasmic adaptor subunit [Pseudomonadota bacterium]
MKTEPNPPVVKRLRQNRVWIVAVGLAAVAGFAGWTLYTPPSVALVRPANQVESDGAFRPTESQWAGFRFTKVEPVSFREERATDGRIAINEDTTTPVFSPYSGRVSRLIAKPGDRVERGAPLFAIEASEFVQGHNDLIAAVAGVEKAKSRLALAQMAEKRQRDLQAIRGGALKDLEQAQSDLVQAQGDLRTAEIALAAVRNRFHILGRSDEEIAELEKQDRVGAETIVVAPIAGTVIQRKVGLGQYINAGATDPVYTIGDLSTVWLVANVRESDAPRMKIGAPVVVNVLAFPGQVFNARLEYVAPALDPNTRRLPVRAVMANPNLELKPEMFASFRIVSGNDRSMPAVPADAIVYEGANARVWVANPETRSVVSRPVVVGDSSNGMVEIRQGLATGDTVVTSGTLFIDRAARRD